MLRRLAATSDTESLKSAQPSQPRNEDLPHFWPLALMLLAAVAELVLFFHQASAAPRAEQYAALRAPVAAMRRPGDVLLVSPAWAEPHVRKALGDSHLPLSAIAPPDDDPDSALQVALLGQGAPPGWLVLETSQQEPFVVRRLAKPKRRPLRANFVDSSGSPSRFRGTREPETGKRFVGDEKEVWR